jgi:uncharacterized membrane protein HdeD (DUF308 family)
LTVAQDLGDAARGHWRRQLVLTVAAIATGLVAFQLVGMSVAREADVETFVLPDGRTLRSSSYLATMWPAAVGIVAVAVVGIVLLVHAYRVAAFTFRRGDT